MAAKRIGLGLALGLAACAGTERAGPAGADADARPGYTAGCAAGEAAVATGSAPPAVPDAAADPAYGAAWREGFERCSASARAVQRRRAAEAATRRAGEAASRQAPLPPVGPR